MSDLLQELRRWYSDDAERAHWVLAAIVLIGFLLRLAFVSTPVLDWHAFRQADTASVTYRYVQEGIDPLVPRYHDLSNIQSGQPNPEGYRMVEFPLVNVAQAAVLRAIPQLPFTPTVRFFSILASIGSIAVLYAVVKELSGKRVALWSALVFAVLPFSIFYGRAVLPEPYLVFSILVSLWGFQRWLMGDMSWRNWQGWGWYALSFVALSVAFLLKPFTVFFAPIFAGLIWFHSSWKRFLDPRVWMLGLASLLPLLAWREWIQRFPSGIPASDWLFNSNDIRFRPAWFRWLFFERLTKLILGWVGVLLLPLNAVWILRRDTIVYALWWIGMLVYFSVIATGNVQHDYYQVIVLPIIAISVGRGIVILEDLLQRFIPKLTRISTVTFSLLLLALMCWGSWQYTKGYFVVNHPEYISAGEYVRSQLPSDAKIIAPAMGDTQFLFQTRRRGWPIGFEIEDKIDQGAEYYITTSRDDEARRLMEEYSVLDDAERFILIDLTQPTATTSGEESS